MFLLILCIFSVIVSYFLIQRPDGCKMIAKKSVVDQTDVVACYRSFPYRSSEAKKTINSIREAMQLSSIIDFTKDNPDPRFFKKKDILKDLDDLKESSFGTEFDFHQTLSKYFISLEEGHTIYQSKGYSTFQLQLPFGLLSFYQDNHVKLQVMEYPIESCLKEEWLRRGIDLNKLNNDFVISIEGVPALDYIRVFADRFVGGSRDPHFRLSKALAQTTEYYPDILITPGYFALPFLTPDRANLTFIFKNNGQLTVPFLAINPGNFETSEDFYINYIKKSSKINGIVKEFQKKKPTSLKSKLIIFEGIFINIYCSEDAAIFAIKGFPNGIFSIYRWERDLINAIKKLTSLNKPKLIIDLSNNSGGLVTAAVQLLETIFPDARNIMFKSYVTNRKPAINEFNKFITKSLLNNNIIDIITEDILRQVSKSIEEKSLSEKPRIPLKIVWTNSPAESQFFEHDQFFTKTMIAVLSNGICSSACALVANWIQEMTDIPTYHIGNFVSEPTTIGSSIGGTLLDLGIPNNTTSQWESINVQNSGQIQFSISFIGFYSLRKPEQNLDFTWLPAHYKLNITYEHHFNPIPIWEEVASKMY